MPSPCVVCKGTLKLFPDRGFFGFPKGEATKALWMKVLNLKDSDLHSDARVCNIHFRSQDQTHLDFNELDEFLRTPGCTKRKRRKLKKGAVPIPVDGSEFTEVGGVSV